MQISAFDHFRERLERIAPAFRIIGVAFCTVHGRGGRPGGGCRRHRWRGRSSRRRSGNRKLRASRGRSGCDGTRCRRADCRSWRSRLGWHSGNGKLRASRGRSGCDGTRCRRADCRSWRSRLGRHSGLGRNLSGTARRRCLGLRGRRRRRLLIFSSQQAHGHQRLRGRRFRERSAYAQQHDGCQTGNIIEGDHFHGVFSLSHFPAGLPPPGAVDAAGDAKAVSWNDVWTDTRPRSSFPPPILILLTLMMRGSLPIRSKKSAKVWYPPLISTSTGSRTKSLDESSVRTPGFQSLRSRPMRVPSLESCLSSVTASSAGGRYSRFLVSWRCQSAFNCLSSSSFAILALLVVISVSSLAISVFKLVMVAWNGSST